jgi:acetyltransferase EpsM
MAPIPFVIIGSGGHAKVVMDALEKNHHAILSIFDDDIKKVGTSFSSGYFIQQTPDIHWWQEHTIQAIIAVGSNQARKKIVEKLGNNVDWGQAIHPSSIIHKSAIIGKDVYIGANVVIQADAIIGDHSIINTGAIIEHDVVVGNYCHVAPRVTLTGHTQVGDGTLIGAGATTIPSIKIGSWCTIGAGSVIVKDIDNSKKAYGNPCTIIS